MSLIDKTKRYGEFLATFRSKRRAAKAESDRKALILERETRSMGIVGDVGSHTNPDNATQAFNRDVLTARGRAFELRSEVEKRKKKNKNK